MAKVETDNILTVFSASLEILANVLQQVGTDIVRDADINRVLSDYCKPMLASANIRLISVEVSKEALTISSTKAERNKEVVPVLYVREITRNTRLIVETVTRSKKLEHHMVIGFFVNSRRHVKIEGEPWIDCTRYPPWSEKMKQHLKEMEESLKPILPTALAQIIELVLDKIARS